MNLSSFALPGVNTSVSAFVVPGAAGFLAAKFVFDASTTKAIVIGAVLGALSLAFVSFNPQPINTP